MDVLLDRKFLSACLCTLKSKKPKPKNLKKSKKPIKKPKNLKTFFNPALRIDLGVTRAMQCNPTSTWNVVKST